MKAAAFLPDAGLSPRPVLDSGDVELTDGLLESADVDDGFELQPEMLTKAIRKKPPKLCSACLLNIMHERYDGPAQVSTL